MEIGALSLRVRDKAGIILGDNASRQLREDVLAVRIQAGARIPPKGSPEAVVRRDGRGLEIALVEGLGNKELTAADVFKEGIQVRVKVVLASLDCYPDAVRVTVLPERIFSVELADGNHVRADEARGRMLVEAHDACIRLHLLVQ